MSAAAPTRTLGLLLAGVLLLNLAIASRADGAEGPSFSMLPDTAVAGAPAGYSLDLNLPSSSASGVGQMSVTLPSGTVISAASGANIETCSNQQFALDSSEPAGCPAGSRVGTAQLEAPAHREPLPGQVFLGAPSCDPCTPDDAQSGRMVRLFVQVQGAGEGAIPFKLEGSGEINQQTGQLTFSFERMPHVPFSNLRLSLGGGAAALLANPRTCGPVTSNLAFVPSGGSSTPEFLADEFAISQECIAPQFHPSAAASAASSQAGGFDPLTLSFTRSNSDEYLAAIQTTLPEGLLGMISSVSLCGEPQADAGTCGAASLIGHATVELGPGSDPVSIEVGEVFITGAYDGAPYGLSIVIPARVGPYALAGTDGSGQVVVRAAVNVNSRTAALTITSAPLPSELDGIPLQLRVLELALDRPGFMFNPTSCNPLQIASLLASVQNATAAVASPFQAGGCRAFTFAPAFAVSTSANASRADGTSLYVKIVDPHTDAVAWKVKAELPRQLPVRLSTLQQACRVATFESNPAACPTGSLVGVARSSMPLISSIFAGPVYFVSYGGAKFPELVIVLQDEGVRVDLHGETFISRAGIASSTFATIPDVPVNYFEMILPAGPHSALAANGNLCQGRLMMPNEFAGENGAVIKRSTQITVTGCPTVKHAHRPKRRHRSRRSSHARANAHRRSGSPR